jgi:hypothetical protein
MRGWLANYGEKAPGYTVIEDGEEGYHHDEAYLKRTFHWLTAFRILPQSGGLDDQDPLWVRDMELMAAIREQLTEAQPGTMEQWFADGRPDQPDRIPG